jgi:hypothetical protein
MIPACEAAGVHQILPDGLGIAATGKAHFDGVSMRFAGAGRWAAAGFRGGPCRGFIDRFLTGIGAHQLDLTGRSFRSGVGGHLLDGINRFCAAGVGGHLIGRFCGLWRCATPPARPPQLDAGLPQVPGRRFAPDTGGFLDSPQRPSQATQGYDLLFLFFTQDVTHSDRG